MPRPREIIDPKRISLLISGKMKKRIERQALYQSSEEGRKIPLTEFLRRIIDIVCPPEETSMRFK